MRRYIESALRMKWRLLIAAIVVFGAAFVGLSLTKGGFTSSSTVWVEKPLYTDDQADPLTRYSSAATVQSNALNELLGTRRFVVGIAESSGMPLNTTVAEGRAIDDIQKHLLVDAAGTHLIRLSYTGDTPEFAQTIISETIAAFLVEMDASKTNQIQVAKRVLTDQLSDAAKALNTSKDALNKYVQNNPGAQNATVTDPTLTDLQKQYEDDRARYSSLTTQMDQLNTSAESSSSAFFRVIDPPSKVQAYKATTKDLVRNVLIGFALAVLTVVGVALVGTWTDPAVYTLNDVSSLALANAQGNSRDLLVGILPYVKSLGEMRRRDTKQLKEQEEGKGRAAPGQAASTPDSQHQVQPPQRRLPPPAPESSAAWTSPDGTRSA